MTTHRKFYLLTLVSMFIFALTSCNTSRRGTVTRTPDNIGAIHVDHGNKNRNKVVDEALTWVGTPYKYAGVDKGVGVDCSGMVMQVYLDATGRKIPRNSAKQAEFCKKLKSDEVNMGDLVFFATGKDHDKVSHVGIIVDNEHFVHASPSKGVVVSQLYTPYYQKAFKMFGRIP